RGCRRPAGPARKGQSNSYEGASQSLRIPVRLPIGPQCDSLQSAPEVERLRKQLRNVRMPPRLTFATGAGDRNIMPGERRSLGDRLAAPAAGHHRLRAASLRVPGHDDMGHLVEPESLLRRGQRRLLRTDAKPVAGIFHIRPDRNGAIRPGDCAADPKTGIRRIRLAGRLPRERHEGFDVVHWVLAEGRSIRRASQTSSRMTGGTNTIDSTTLASAWPASNSPIGRTP